MFRDYHYLNGSFRCWSSMLHCSLSRQSYNIHSRCMRQNESKILSSQLISRLPTRFLDNRVGKRLINFIAELYTSQTKFPFYILTSNPQIIRGNLDNWRITRFGHASTGRGDSRINNEIRSSLSRNRITVSLKYVPTHPRKPLISNFA